MDNTVCEVRKQECSSSEYAIEKMNFEVLSYNEAGHSDPYEYECSEAPVYKFIYYKRRPDGGGKFWIQVQCESIYTDPSTFIKFQHEIRKRN